MAIPLIEEIFDHAPAALSGSELVLLLIIAERANVKTREAWQGDTWDMGTVLSRLRLSRIGLNRVFQRLAEKGCEVRKPLKTDKNGAPVYAWEGRSMTFCLPRFVEGAVIENLNYLAGHPMRVELLPSEETDVSDSPEDVQEYTHSGNREYIHSPQEDAQEYTLADTDVHPLQRERVYRSTPHIRHPVRDPSSLGTPSDDQLAQVVDLAEKREKKSAAKTNPKPTDLVAGLLTPDEDPARITDVIVECQRKGVRYPVAFFNKLHHEGHLQSWVDTARDMIREQDEKRAAAAAEAQSRANRATQRASEAAAAPKKTAMPRCPTPTCRTIGVRGSDCRKCGATVPLIRPVAS